MMFAQIPHAQWPYKTLDVVMRPLDQLRTVRIDTPVIKAMEIMGRDDINQLPVIVNGALEGIIYRSHILQLLQTKAALGGAFYLLAGTSPALSEPRTHR